MNFNYNFVSLQSCHSSNSFRVLLFTTKDLRDNHCEDASLCTSIYLSEPQDWMKKMMKSEMQGKVYIIYCSNTNVFVFKSSPPSSTQWDRKWGEFNFNPLSAS